jgi:hypothetical protein
MTSFDFTESQYRFTSPIRYFKANDPIYYEVDNIPLKQLHENDMWLKDQIFNLRLSTEGGVERQNINELRPYVTGSDNVIKVKPGRFTARINDAYSITPLQVITKIAGDAVDAYNTWTAESLSSANLASVIQAFKQAVAINLNGLVERAFTRPAFIPDTADTTYTSYARPQINLITGTEQDTGQPPYPGVGAILWSNFNDSRSSQLPSTSYFIRQYDSFQATIGFSRLGSAETAFIKRWRGVARTAVVDVPDELNIEVPRFNEEDYFYYNEQGVKVYLTAATQRVDLLFIYSKPVDTSSVTIGKYVNGTPSVITKAELGIVYGAGLGVNFKQSNTRNQQVLDANGVTKNFPATDDSTLPDGTMKMLAHFGDELGQNTGFGSSGSTIRGSFPAPDDLMNLSPLLDESLSTSSITLVGQSVLPIAYIVVKKNANLNSEGVPVISSSDVIDIRPFFRTTELSYNERAGIAAAVPSLSIANPVVTQSELDYELKKVRTDVISRIPTIPNVERPTYETFYIPTEKTIFNSEPKLIFQKFNPGNAIGTYQNPKDWFINEADLVSATPILFPPVANEPSDKYSRYLKSIIVRAEAICGFAQDMGPHSVYVGVVPGNAPQSQQAVYYKGAWASTARSREQYGAGAINTFEIPVIPYSTTVPTLPLIVKSFATNDINNLIINSSDNYPIFSDPSNTEAILFNLYLVGYKVIETVRLRGVTV